MITYDDFKKVEIRAGRILSVEKVPNTDKLLKLSVDFNEFEEVAGEASEQNREAGVSGSMDLALNGANVQVQETERKETKSEKILKPRQIISGIAGYFPDHQKLVGKICLFVTNLEPRTIKGLESNGMLFALSTPEGGFSLLEPNNTIPPGTLAG